MRTADIYLFDLLCGCYDVALLMTAMGAVIQRATGTTANRSIRCGRCTMDAAFADYAWAKSNASTNQPASVSPRPNATKCRVGKANALTRPA